MPTYDVTGYQWAGFGNYPTSQTVTIDDDDPLLDWFGGDIGAPQTATFGGNTYTIAGAGLIPSDIRDNDGGGGVVSEELLFMNLVGYGWMFVPMPGSVFTDGDDLVAWTPPVGWSDTDGVEHDSIICFCAGSRIDTPAGPMPVEAIGPGQVVLTRDNGPQVVRWAGSRRIGTGQLAANPQLRPIRIPKDAIAPGIPACETYLSRQHRVLVDRTVATGLAGAEYLAPAVSLSKSGLARIDGTCTPVHYVHFMFDAHQIVTCDGLESESFFPGDYGLACLEDDARAELFALFPGLAGDPGSYGPLARAHLPAGRASRLMA